MLKSHNVLLSWLFADLLAVPKHPYAAMENWGLSVFVEQKILLDADVSSSSYQMELTMVVVHEICHQVGSGLMAMTSSPTQSTQEQNALISQGWTLLIMKESV